MAGWVWVLIVVAIVIVLVVIAAAAARRRRTATLQERFGPEYERTVRETDGRRQAEADLRNRAKQHDQLELRPIPEAARVRYSEEWRIVQEQFVDQPSSAVGVAEGLLHRVMAARGYPVDDFDEQADLVSVDHPHVVANYRSAHAIHQRAQTQRATTEDLRQAMVNYRALFDELLDADRGGRDLGNETAGEDRGVYRADESSPGTRESSPGAR